MNIKKTKSTKVAILLAVYNGEKFLIKQLESIKNQSYKNWVIYARDDGSIDNSILILQDFQRKIGKNKIVIHKGKNIGYQYNFFELIMNKKNNGDLFFLCDQDDIWFKNKIKDIVSFFNNHDHLGPLLYCGRSILIDENDNIIGSSNNFTKKTSLNNALVQSIAGGNTMAFNKKLKLVIEKNYRCFTKNVVHHDWTIYLVNELFNGLTFFDKDPKIYYRQHNNSVIGNNNTFFSKVIRFYRLIAGDYKYWNAKNFKLLGLLKNQVDSHKKKLFINFYKNIKHKNFYIRVLTIKRNNIYRQGFFANLTLYLGAILKKL
jgi:glycosyltransferase involved in cell wall biosynthesis